jgi:hypothetical protein
VEPDQAHLRSLMRHVVSHPEEARRKGAQARRDVTAEFAPSSVTDRVEARLVRAHNVTVVTAGPLSFCKMPHPPD